MSLSVMIVRAEFADTAPKAFQEYVQEYFNLETLFGVSVYTAGTYISAPNHGQFKRGKSPCHSVDLMRYTEGLPQGQSLSEWIWKQSTDDVRHFHLEEDRTPVIDDD